jgi:hypothetical protein
VAHIPAPRRGFVETLQKIKYDGEQRWRDDAGRIYTWDQLHGHFEVFDKRGHHLGVVDLDGRYAGPAKKGRTIDV